jgi:PilZ domain-containing protein
MQDEESHFRGERRSFLRQPMHPLVYVTLGAENGGIIINLSEDGMAVQAAMALVHDRMPVLLFQLAGSKDSIVTSGRIVWKSDSGTFAGVQFEDMLEPMRDLIKSWIAAESPPKAQYEAEIAAGFREDFPAEFASKTKGVLQKEMEAGVQIQISPGPLSMSAPAGPLSSFAASNSTLPRTVVPPAASPAAVPAVRPADLRLSIGGRPVQSLPAGDVSSDRKWRTAFLIAGLAALSAMAGWAIGRDSLSRVFRSTRGSNVANEPRFSQVHPIDSFAGAADARDQPPALSQPLQVASFGKQGWIYIGEITPESTWAGDYPKNVRSVPWPIEKGGRVTITNEVWIRDASRPSAHIVGRLHTGETVIVAEVALLHARLGGNFVWAEVSTAAAAKP